MQWLDANWFQFDFNLILILILVWKIEEFMASQDIKSAASF